MLGQLGEDAFVGVIQAVYRPSSVLSTQRITTDSRLTQCINGKYATTIV